MRSRHGPRNRANYSQPVTANRFPQPPTAFNDLWLASDKLKLRQWTWKPGKDILQGKKKQWVVLFPTTRQQDTLWKRPPPARWDVLHSSVLWSGRIGTGKTKVEQQDCRRSISSSSSAGTWISVGLISGHRVKQRKCHGCSLQPDHQQVSEIHSELVCWKTTVSLSNAMEPLLPRLNFAS